MDKFKNPKSSLGTRRGEEADGVPLEPQQRLIRDRRGKGGEPSGCTADLGSPNNKLSPELKKLEIIKPQSGR